MAFDLPLSGRRLLTFVEDLYEELELWYPRLRLIEAGATVDVAGPQAGRSHPGKSGYPCVATHSLADIEPADYDGVILAGGFAPDKLRRDERVLRAVRAVAASGGVVAAICHGGWIAISAGVYRGVRVTGSLGIRDDLVNAGAIWEDRPVVVDGRFVSSRKPDDLPDFCRAILELLSSRS